MRDKKINDLKELRCFGIIFGSLWLILGIIKYFQLKSESIYFIIFGNVILTGGIFIPSVLKPLHKLLGYIWLLIINAISTIILSIVYYLIITPIGLAARICKKDFLNLKIDKNSNTYWIEKKEDTLHKERFEQQY
ncbi:MAG: hypothetical protein ABH952_01095 [Candidatus Omnitrophota bacterium]